MGGMNNAHALFLCSRGRVGGLCLLSKLIGTVEYRFVGHKSLWVVIKSNLKKSVMGRSLPKSVISPIVDG